MKNKQNLFSSIDMKTVIYFAVLAVILIPMALTKTLTVSAAEWIVILTTVVYTIATKRWYLFQIALALIMGSYTIQFTSQVYYSIKYQDPTFISSVIVLSAFLILFITTWTNHSEWSIHSPWIGLTYGFFASMLTGYIAIATNSMRNVYFVGGVSAITIFIVSLLYMLFGFRNRVHEPELFTDFNEDKLQSGLNQSEFNVKRNKHGELVIYDNTDDSIAYRTFITKDKIAHMDVDKHWKEWLKVHNKKSQFIYAWLLQQSVKSFETRGPKPIKQEYFVIVNIVDKTTGHKIINVTVPRSKQTRKVALLNVSEKDFYKLGKYFEELAPELKLTK